MVGAAAARSARLRAATAASSPRPGFLLGGDVSVIRDRIAITNSNFADIRIDESAHFSSSVTALIESLDAKGTATGGRALGRPRCAG